MKLKFKVRNYKINKLGKIPGTLKTGEGLSGSLRRSFFSFIKLKKHTQVTKT